MMKLRTDGIGFFFLESRCKNTYIARSRVHGVYFYHDAASIDIASGELDQFI